MAPEPRPLVDGVLLVDKEPGITSHDVVDRVRKVTRIKKVGHTGTLDPLATGLLVLCLGNATRLQSLLMGMEKVYEGTIQFGWSTDTYDAAGTPLGDEVGQEVDAPSLVAAAAKFTGDIEQMPPAFSAKKVDGVRAYELARRGEVPLLRTKAVRVDEFSILDVTGSTAAFRVRCSAGTYVRSLAHDIGTTIGIPAHLKELRRTAIGRLTVLDAIASQEITRENSAGIVKPPQYVPIERLDLPIAAVLIDPSQESKVRRGQTVITKPSADIQVSAGDLVSLVNLNDQLVAIGSVTEVLRVGGPVVVQPKTVLRPE